MINILQVTNFSDEVTSAPIEYRNVLVGNKELKNIPYYVLDLTTLTKSDLFPLNKLGYCCDPRGIGYPIFISIYNKETQQSKETKFEVGKTGMFEFQKYEWRDVNKDPNTEYIAEIFATEVKIPATGITFTLDYCYDNA